jgi:hypothetical protein
MAGIRVFSSLVHRQTARLQHRELLLSGARHHHRRGGDVPARQAVSRRCKRDLSRHRAHHDARRRSLLQVKAGRDAPPRAISKQHGARRPPSHCAAIRPGRPSPRPTGKRARVNRCSSYPRAPVLCFRARTSRRNKATGAQRTCRARRLGRVPRSSGTGRSWK